LHCLVTSGGTREPIDDVRLLTNASTGRLGARMTDALLAQGHTVTLLHGVNAALPEGKPERVVFDTSRQLRDHLRVYTPSADVVLHAAAVSDFLPEQRKGKISSDQQTLMLKLNRAPKLVEELRDLAPSGLLVGFKLTSGLSEEARIERALGLLDRARLDMVVVNDATALDERSHQALLVTADGILGRACGKTEVAEQVVAALGTLEQPA
jgi:phosphopantothenoylcysteine synthetase/decarboxylase